MWHYNVGLVVIRPQRTVIRAKCSVACRWPVFVSSVVDSSLSCVSRAPARVATPPTRDEPIATRNRNFLPRDAMHKRGLSE